MRKAEPQHTQTRSQAAAPGGAALETPQSDQIAQLEALIEESPQAEKLGRLAAMIDASPAMAAQRKLAGMMHNSPYMAAQAKLFASIHNSPRQLAQKKTFDAIHHSPAQTAQREQFQSLFGGVTQEHTTQRQDAKAPQAELAQRAEAAPKPNNTGLPDNLKSGIENLSGISMDSVRVHYNSSQPAQLNALAYAQGTDIHIALGQEKHLPHEAWHVVQQAQGRVRSTVQMKEGVSVNDDEGLEREADVMGARVTAATVQPEERARLTPAATQPPSAIAQRAAVIQLEPIPATVTGLTHLVQAQGGSIFEGDEAGEVTEGMQIEIETDNKIRSRRGPNQEMNRAADYGGGHIYRWVNVLKVKGEAVGANVYIRDDAFVTARANALGSRPSVISPDHRYRTGGMPSQNVRLVGTRHSRAAADDKSGRIADKDLANADLIVEHPTPAGRKETQIDTTIGDITQENLIKKAGDSGARVIGADGRKLIDEQQQRHALSIRSQPQGIELAQGVDKAQVMRLAGQFVRICLGLEDGDIASTILQITQLGTYVAPNRSTSAFTAPDVAAVLHNDFRRVSTITKYFKPEVRAALAGKVFAVFQHDVLEAVKGEEEERDGYIEYAKNAQNNVTAEAFNKEIAQYEKRIRLAMIPPFHDAICNLTLFSEALASNRQNMVVAFGAEHVKPLVDLMKEVNGVHKHYDIEDKT